jgi:hypothetical protein
MGKQQQGKDKEPGKEVAKRTAPGALAQNVYDADDLAQGFEGITGEDLLIPFLAILQKGSPAVDETLPGYIPGAKAGMIINTVTQDLYAGDEGIMIIPLHRDHKFVEWTPRDSGGGFKGLHAPEEPMIQEARRGQAFGKLESPDGNDLVETFYVYGLAVDDDGSANPAMIAFASTQIKQYKRWMTSMRAIQLRGESGERVTPPMFAHAFRLKTKGQSNPKGTWYGWDIRFAEQHEEGATAAERSRLAPDDEYYVGAKELRALILANKVKVAYDSQAPETEEDAEVDAQAASPGNPGKF